MATYLFCKPTALYKNRQSGQEQTLHFLFHKYFSVYRESQITFEIGVKSDMKAKFGIRPQQAVRSDQPA